VRWWLSLAILRDDGLNVIGGDEDGGISDFRLSVFVIPMRYRRTRYLTGSGFSNR
jgi:hypothetical protein